MIRTYEVRCDTRFEMIRCGISKETSSNSTRSTGLILMEMKNQKEVGLSRCI